MKYRVHPFGSRRSGPPAALYRHVHGALISARSNRPALEEISRGKPVEIDPGIGFGFLPSHLSASSHLEPIRSQVSDPETDPGTTLTWK